ncbi:hypothetical protein [Microbispora sp. GKU 823]|uniref:hypothetical protein n=1 Tax=Microbispora sp. GKU 823 TaxID=1652100 RepID=UPI0009A2E933|nr:hypothetical protein [Microbispora sp. GKU 823]OPG14186.1 hypothetical protein B1L11_03920 [Microbispora sp. GKU 823]
MDSQPPPDSGVARSLWLAVAALFSLVIALVAGILKSQTGAGLAESALVSGGAFATAMALCLAVLSAAQRSR